MKRYSFMTIAIIVAFCMLCSVLGCLPLFIEPGKVLICMATFQLIAIIILAICIISIIRDI